MQGRGGISRRGADRDERRPANGCGRERSGSRMRLALVADRVFTAQSDKRDAVVVVIDGASLSEWNPTSPADGTPVLRLPGATLLPGLIDAHTHVSIVPSRGNQIEQMKLPVVRAAGDGARQRAGRSACRGHDAARHGAGARRRFPAAGRDPRRARRWARSGVRGRADREARAGTAMR